MLVALGWDVSFDEPSGCDWCPTCTSARSDLQATIQRVRELCEAKAQEVAASDPLFGHPCALYVDDILRVLEGDA